MMSKKKWRTEIVLLFCGAQFLCVVLGQMDIWLLHQLGVSGFQKAESFGNILLATLSFQGVTWILIPIFLRLHQVRLRDLLGFSQRNVLRPSALAMGVLAVMLPVAVALESLSALVMEKLHWQPQEEIAVKLFTTAHWWPTGVYLALFAIVIAPVAEEFIFRGVLFPYIKELGFPKTAWLGVSFLFALIHMDAAAFTPLFALALALTWLYEYTDSLLAPIAVHAMFNGANLVMLIVLQHSGFGS